MTVFQLYTALILTAATMWLSLGALVAYLTWPRWLGLPLWWAIIVWPWTLKRP